MRSKHYWRKALITQGLVISEKAVCTAQNTINMLKDQPEPPVSWISRIMAFFTTPFKRMGISGWKETGCFCDCRGFAVRDAQHSSDGFWTIDVKLESFIIGEITDSNGKFIRIEVEPQTKAHSVCEYTTIFQGAKLLLGGPVVIDLDGPFLEVHPDDNFKTEKSGSLPTP